MTKEHAIPLFRTPVLIAFGAFAVTLFTLFGVFNNPGELIREDVTLGPVIAASKILAPLFMTIGLVYYLASIKKCAVCGKIIFWGKKDS